MHFFLQPGIDCQQTMMSALHDTLHPLLPFGLQIWASLLSLTRQGGAAGGWMAPAAAVLTAAAGRWRAPRMARRHCRAAVGEVALCTWRAL